ncbi:hypothetical protein HYC85_005422 [Camellia sinensis]|uniref:Uncharacterized protein n=1 Tax=Camellia sinensis TaxID=4442 RepID=A0A7J7I0P2_CAMSI|nr:hypothetical protein HYC85_005422 [Camellia sinensis]
MVFVSARSMSNTLSATRDRCALKEHYNRRNINQKEEIEYPSNPTQKLQLLETEEDIEIDDSVEILEDFPTQQTKVEEVSERDELERDSSIEILDVFPKCQTSRAADMEKDGSVEKNIEEARPLMGKLEPSNGAKAFKSENPFFMVSMHPSYRWLVNGDSSQWTMMVAVADGSGGRQCWCEILCRNVYEVLS